MKSTARLIGAAICVLSSLGCSESQTPILVPHGENPNFEESSNSNQTNPTQQSTSTQQPITLPTGLHQSVENLNFKEFTNITQPNTNQQSTIIGCCPGYIRVSSKKWPGCTSQVQPLTVIDTAECKRQPLCDSKSKYRTIDGSCCNLQHPSWGQAGTPFSRLLPAHYEDGKGEPRLSVTGRPLPNVRYLSATFFPERNILDSENTLNLMLWSQLIAHDFTHIHTPRPGSVPCCTSDNQLLPTKNQKAGCYPIQIYPNDYFYSQFNVTCHNINRAYTVDSGTNQGSPKEQVNIITHVIDASMVYGSDITTANLLRSFQDGKLKAQTTSDGRNFLPNLGNNNVSDFKSYFAGDDRVNQNCGLTVLQIALLRLHNYFCDKLLEVNPGWKDETLYQESRRILAAFLHHVTYKHILPIMLGKEYMYKKGLSVDNCCDCCINYHNPNINPSTITEFSGAAYRSFHSLIPQGVVLVNNNYEAEDFLKFDDTFFKPSFIHNAGVVDKCMRGFANQPQQSQDHFFSHVVNNLLFKFDKPWGYDLGSIDLHRSLDLGLPTYNDMRHRCGLQRARWFRDFEDVMSEESVRKLESIYVSVDDVHLFLGGMLEELIPGTLVGPTFQCIIGEQFYHYMRGDRFYYENCGMPWSFTQDQLNEIYKMSVAWMFCVTGDDIQTIQFETFQKPSGDNPIVPCSQISAPDFGAWKE